MHSSTPSSTGSLPEIQIPDKMADRFNRSSTATSATWTAYQNQKKPYEKDIWKWAIKKKEKKAEGSEGAHTLPKAFLRTSLDIGSLEKDSKQGGLPSPTQWQRATKRMEVRNISVDLGIENGEDEDDRPLAESSKGDKIEKSEEDPSDSDFPAFSTNANAAPIGIVRLRAKVFEQQLMNNIKEKISPRSSRCTGHLVSVIRQQKESETKKKHENWIGGLTLRKKRGEHGKPFLDQQCNDPQVKVIIQELTSLTYSNDENSTPTLSYLHTILENTLQAMNLELFGLFKEITLSFHTDVYLTLAQRLHKLKLNIAKHLENYALQFYNEVVSVDSNDLPELHLTNMHDIQKMIEESITAIKKQLLSIKNELDQLFSSPLMEVMQNDILLRALSCGRTLGFAKRNLDHLLSESQTLRRNLTFLLEGEKLCQKEDHATFTDANRYKMVGCLFITNFRLVFLPQDLNQRYFVPLACILSVDKLGKKVKKDGKTYSLDILCKEIRRVEIGLVKTSLSRRMVIELLTYTKKLRTVDLFAFSYCQKFPVNGWDIYRTADELDHLGLPCKEWRISELNVHYEMCDSYPHLIAVPATVSDEILDVVAKYRSRGRLPVLVWKHPTNHATLTRSSQPRTGIKGKNCPEDQFLLREILAATPNCKTLNIIDARPRVAAVANQAKGAGYENVDNYENCKITFLGIPNIHSMRESINKLRDACLNTSPDDPKWWSTIETTGWFHYLRLILAGAETIVRHIQCGQSVLNHCSDGWDRTAQLVSLAQIMLDPYYRTLTGIESLIEKEWLSFGHKFSQRIGSGDDAQKEEERSPVFPQFVDCLWQITRQYPTHFQFNESFLILLVEHCYSCQFGTFLFNTEKERIENQVTERTVSLWSYVNSNAIEFINPFYLPSNMIITKVSAVQKLQFWPNLYFRWRPELIETNNSAQDLIEVHENEKIKELEREIAQLKKELQQYKEKETRAWKNANKKNANKKKVGVDN